MSATFNDDTLLSEPEVKRAVVFIEGQNLYHAARHAFGYTYPNYEIAKLANKICSDKGWELNGIRFYTGVPKRGVDPLWHEFWSRKLRSAKKEGIDVFTRELREHLVSVDICLRDLFPDDENWKTISRRYAEWATYEFIDSFEKGVDVRIAIDIIRFALKREYDVGGIFSQDQDLSEVAKEIPYIAREQNRWIRVVSAYPYNEDIEDLNKRGIDFTDWIKIDRDTYDQCIDSRDYIGKDDQSKLDLD